MYFLFFAAAVTLMVGTLGTIGQVFISSYFTPINNAFSIIVLNSIIGYAIATKHIFGIDVILRRSAIYLSSLMIIIICSLAIWFVGNHLFPARMIGRTIWFPLILAIALSVVLWPLYGRMGFYMNSLFKGSLNIPEDILARGSHILQSITTTKQLVLQSSRFLSSIMGAEKTTILLREGETFRSPILSGPEAGAGVVSLDAESDTIKWIKRHHEPLARYTLKRMTITAEQRRMEKELERIDADTISGIYFKSELIGIIILGKHKRGDIYDKIKLEALWLFANQLAISLQNTILYSEIQNQNIYTKSLLENLVNGVVAVDSQKHITVCNTEAERILGIKEDALKAKGIELLPEEMKRAIERIFSSSRPIRNLEAKITNRAQETIFILMGGALIRGHEGNVTGTLLVFNDQTAIKHLESQVRRSERLTSAGQLAAGMAHEIKNPLVTIKTFAELLPIQYDDDEFRNEFSSLVGEEIKRIDNIVNQLLNFARPAKPNFTPTNIHETITHALELLDRELRKNNIAVNKSLDSDNDLVRADANQLHQVFVNLMLNAITAMRNGNGELTIASERIERLTEENGITDMKNNGPYIKLDFKDNGCGISEDNLRRIFDPFYTSSASGSGMGLSVAHTIITDNGGSINVSSQIGTGSTFSVILPILHRESDV